MSRISVDVSSARIPVLQVGYQGENEVTDVLFDISSWITEFGEGVARLRVKRPGNSEEESYVLSLTITDGIAVWTVSETDTFNKGNGKVQLSYLVGNIVKKAVIYPYKVGKSIVGADNPVDPFDSWIERSKAWAIGETLDGNAVPETDETYQNNAKYYAEQADILGSAQVVLATEQATLATEKATLATVKADAAANSETNAAASEAAVNGVSTQLTTRMTAIETEQSVQSARMDTFTSLPEGSTSGNAELADIRVGADGTTYDTAGNAVRGQIGELKSDVNSITEKHYSVIDSSSNVLTKYDVQGYIDADNGKFEPNNVYDCYWFTMPITCDVWFDTQSTWGQIAVYNGTIFETANYIGGGSLSRNTLPYENNKLNIKRGMNVVICRNNKSPDYDFKFHYVDRIDISEEQFQLISNKIDVNGKLAPILDILEENEKIYNRDSQPFFEAYQSQGFIDADNGHFEPLNGYQCYIANIPKNCELWFETKDDWLELGIYNGTALDPNTKIAVYANSRGTIPFEYNKINIQAGMNIVVCVTTDSDFKMHIKDGSYDVSQQQIEHIAKEIGIKPYKISIEKIAENKFNVNVPSKDGERTVVYQFIKYKKIWSSLSYTDASGTTQTATNVESSNYWNNIEVVDGNNVPIAQGNSNFIVRVVDDNFHCGDGHGNEVIEYIAFVIDGVIVDIDGMSVGDIILCNDFRIIENSKIYKVGGGTGDNDENTNYPALDTNGNPITRFKHKMEMHINADNEVIIKNKLIILEDGIQFDQCHGAMLECYYGRFNNVICNNGERTRNVIDENGQATVSVDSSVNLRNNPSQKCNEVEMYGKDYYINQEIHQDDVFRSDKTRTYFLFYNNRLKCYFQPVITTLGKFTDETRETFNAGDSIGVTAKRVIELR